MTKTESTTIAERSESETKPEESELTNAIDENTVDGNAIGDQPGQQDQQVRHKTSEGNRRTPPQKTDPRKYLYQGALVVLVLLAVVALFQFYMSTLDGIRTFVAEQYRPLFNAAFNLVVLLAAGIGISFVVRSMD